MIGALLRWWYGVGWQMQVQSVTHRWLRWSDYFSFAIIIQTLFAPFRQIGAGATGGPLETQIRQWADRSFSRLVGFFVRLCTLLVGAICMLGLGIFSIGHLFGWLILPLMPVLGVLLTILGWLPWQI